MSNIETCVFKEVIFNGTIRLFFLNITFKNMYISIFEILQIHYVVLGGGKQFLCNIPL